MYEMTSVPGGASANSNNKGGSMVTAEQPWGEHSTQDFKTVDDTSSSTVSTGKYLCPF